MSPHDPLTQRIIGCAYRVANELGHGFLEKVYENALAHELRKADLKVVQQQGIQVHDDGLLVGEFAADLLVEDTVIVELKAGRAIDDSHVTQCLNYLKATGLETCLLINFGKARIDVRRFNRSGERIEEAMAGEDEGDGKREKEKRKRSSAGDEGDEGDKEKGKSRISGLDSNPQR